MPYHLELRRCRLEMLAAFYPSRGGRSLRVRSSQWHLHPIRFAGLAALWAAVGARAERDLLASTALASTTVVQERAERKPGESDLLSHLRCIPSTKADDKPADSCEVIDQGSSIEVCRPRIPPL